MSIVFNPENHSYLSNDNESYVSVTRLIGLYKPKFDQVTAALKASRNRKSKWYNIKPEEIVEIWRKESERSVQLGNWYHYQRELDLLQCSSIRYDSVLLPIFSCQYDSVGCKISTSQKLEEGIYPEFLLYLPSAGIAGQSDRITVANGKVDILDYKTNKEIKSQSFKDYDGISEKMLYPLNHLDNCNLNHYAIQLSIYMYIVLKHNPEYSPGKLTLHHIIFEEDFDKDPYGYPIYLKDDQGNFIVKEVIPYNLPYMKDEVIQLLQHYKLTKHGKTI